MHLNLWVTKQVGFDLLHCFESTDLHTPAFLLKGRLRTVVLYWQHI